MKAAIARCVWLCGVSILCVAVGCHKKDLNTLPTTQFTPFAQKAPLESFR